MTKKKELQRHTRAEDMSPMITKHVSLSLPKIQPKMMGSSFMSQSLYCIQLTLCSRVCCMWL